MSHSTNSNVNFCDVCDLSFETKKCLYRHQSYDSKHKECLVLMMKPQSMSNPKLKSLYPHHPNPYLKTWRECMTHKKNNTSLDLSLKLRVKLKLRVSLRPRVSLKLRVYLKITPKISLN